MFHRSLWFATAVACGSILISPCRADDPPPRPNILFLLADDWMYPHASCLGDPVVQTPTFDRLAREGVLLRNAYAAAPSCTPSRGAMLTGQWHWRLEHGANLNIFLPSKFDTYPDLLEKAGYHIGFMRKGWAPGQATGGGRTRNPAGPRFRSFAQFLAARPRGKPFCFWFGSTDPHRPYAWESGVDGGLDPAKVVVPPYLPDCETVRKDICDYYSRVQRFDRRAGELLAMLERTGELDNTLVVMTGDNGWPFPRCKATVYETGTHEPMAIRWGARVKPGLVVDDFVSLSDLAPTFLEAAGLAAPKAMTARSLMPILKSKTSGWIDPVRDHVLMGMETHSVCRPVGNDLCVGYPMRAIRTKDFHFIRNFKPERWPTGDPNGCDVAGETPFTYDQLAGNAPVGFAATRLAFGDVDASPTKAWMMLHREDPRVEPLWKRAFDKRPAQELYDLREDPYQMRNVADDPAYANTLRQLEDRLMSELTATGDPRAAGRGDEFDEYNESRRRQPQN